MFARINRKSSKGRWLRLILALEKFRLVIISSLLTRMTGLENGMASIFDFALASALALRTVTGQLDRKA
jgi:hypothetical protein